MLDSLLSIFSLRPVLLYEIKFCAGFELYNFTSGNFNFFLGAGIDTCTGSLLRNAECAETDDCYLVVFKERFGDSVESSVKSGFSLNF